MEKTKGVSGALLIAFLGMLSPPQEKMENLTAMSIRYSCISTLFASFHIKSGISY